MWSADGATTEEVTCATVLPGRGATRLPEQRYCDDRRVAATTLSGQTFGPAWKSHNHPGRGRGAARLRLGALPGQGSRAIKNGGNEATAPMSEALRGPSV